MTAASKLSLKPCRKTQQGFHARKSVAAQRGKVSMPVKVLPRSAARFSHQGKCSCAARQAFPTRENVPHEPGKLFPPGKTFPWNRASFSHPGKCPSETEQGFPTRGNVPLKPSKVFPLGEMSLGNRASFFHPGKCPSETEQAFPDRGNVPRKPSKLFPPGEMSLGNRARFSRPGKCSSETDDEYASWDVTYYMNGNLLNRLPQIKKLKWREVFCFRGLWGHLTDKNNPTKERNEGLYRIPDNTYRMNATPYMETSVGIENILKFLRIDYVWRLNYRNHSNIQKSGIRMTMSLSF